MIKSILRWIGIFFDKITDWIAIFSIWIFPAVFSIYIILKLLSTNQDISKFTQEIGPPLLTLNTFVFTITIAILTIPHLVKDEQAESPSRKRYIPLVVSFLGVFSSIYTIIFSYLSDIPKISIIQLLAITLTVSFYSFTTMTVLLPHLINKEKLN